MAKGVGGSIRLVNCTRYDWAVTMPKPPYQMNTWAFPPMIPSMKSEVTYIEFGKSWLKSPKDDAGNVTIGLVDTPFSFELQARCISGTFTLQVYLENIATADVSRGDIVRVGFEKNGEVSFIMSGSEDKNFTMINTRAGKFSWGSVPQQWMQYNIGTLGQRPLRDICMPGTHNAGMSKPNGGTPFGTPNNCLCQSLSVFGQLSAGSRYFDIRPVKSGGIFKTGHYSNLGDVLKYQGMNGQSVTDIINDVNNFTSSNNELVILNVSHDLQTDQGYRNFTVAEWTDLFTLMLDIKKLFIRPASTATVLADLPLSAFIGGGGAAVVVLVDPNVIPEGFANRGFYPLTELRIHDQYSHTNNTEVMINKQVKEMRSAAADSFFVLSWTLTQMDAWDVATTSLEGFAEEVNPMLYTRLLSLCTKQAYPNAIYIDYIKGTNRNIAALAMAVNNLYGL